MNSPVKAASLTFVVVLVAIVGIAALGGVLTAEDTTYDAPENPEISSPQYDFDRVSPNTSPGTADISMDETDSNKTIVVDVGQFVLERDVMPLVNALVEGGHEVIIHEPDSFGGVPQPGPGPISGSAQVGQPGQGTGGSSQDSLRGRLQKAHAFVSIGVDGYTSDQIDAISNFTSDGGRAVFMTNPLQEYVPAFSSANLLGPLGVYVQPGYVYNMEDNDMNYQRIFAEPETDSVLTEGVDQVVLSTATPVEVRSGDAVLRPTEGAELSTTRDSTEAPVVVRNESTVLIGDSRFMKPENTQRADNDVFVGNIADFLVSGDRLVESDFDSGNGEAGDDEEGSGEAVTVRVAPDGEPIFKPQELQIDPGTTVRFEWAGSGYNIVPMEIPDGAQWEGVPEPKDEGFVHEFTFTVEGTYVYTSGPHQEQGMIAGIIVGQPDQ